MQSHRCRQGGSCSVPRDCNNSLVNTASLGKIGLLADRVKRYLILRVLNTSMYMHTHMDTHVHTRNNKEEAILTQEQSQSPKGRGSN